MTNIYCNGDMDMDLLAIFRRLSDSLPENGKFFDKLQINNTKIVELMANTTRDLLFDDIVVEQAKSLRRIDANAFGDTTGNTTSLRIFYNPSLGDSHSLFAAVRQFTEIVVLSLDFNNITEIPTGALSHHDILEDVTLRGPSITRIGDQPFRYLRLLNTLEITQTNIDYIPESAFMFDLEKDGSLVFIFNDNYRMNSTGFAINSLTQFRRPVDFNYLSKSHDKVLDYLDERVFAPYLKANKHNALALVGLKFDCQNCDNYWLVNNEEFRRRSGYFVCTDGKPLTDLTHFLRCE